MPKSLLTCHFQVRILFCLLLISGYSLHGQLSSGDFTYTVDEGEITITRIACGASDVVVPAMIEGLPVTTIADGAMRFCTSIETLSLPNTLKAIGYQAFNSCTNLTTVNLPENLEVIGRIAFYNCSALSSLRIPASVSTIGQGAFGQCSALIGLEVAPGNPNFQSVNGILFSKDMTRLLRFDPDTTGHYDVPPSITGLDQQAFAGSVIESVSIPEGIESLPYATFSTCESLRSVDLPQSLLVIASTAFENCRNLESITIPNNVTSIERWAFSNCSALESVVVPENVTTIGDFTFTQCSSLVSVQLSSKLEELGEGAFRNCSSLTTLNLPATLETIGNYPFQGCTKLVDIDWSGENPFFEMVDGVIFTEDMTELITCFPPTSGEYVIPSTVTSIRDGAFRTSRVTSVVVPESITELGWTIFNNCSDLVSVTLPDTLTTLGNAVFYNCSALESIHLPSSITSMGDQMFRYNHSLTEVTLPDSIDHIGFDTFASCTSLVEITIPAGVKTMGERMFQYSDNLQRVIFQGEPPVIENPDTFWPDPLPNVYYDPEMVGWKDTYYGVPTTPYIRGSFWPDLPHVADNWMKSDWYGWMQDYGEWVWHLEHGWQTFVGNNNQSFYVYDRGIETWFYTNNILYPSLYIFGTYAGWYQYNAGSIPGRRWFLRWDTEEWKRESSFTR